jgi:uncharacterized membrane protein YhaH (DUF805 family)
VSDARPAPTDYLAGAPAGPWTAVVQGFANGFTYRGRASLSAYWWLYLFTLLLGTATGVVIGATGAFGHGKALVIALASLVLCVLVLYAALALLAALVRRLHDTGRSGRWLWVVVVPLAGVMWLVVLALMPATVGWNRYQD